MTPKIVPIVLMLLAFLPHSMKAQGWEWIPDLGDGTYKNPIIHADYSDPDIVKVGSDFYMTASSFNVAPGLPILHSKDLVNWEIIGHAFQQQKDVEHFKLPRHGAGVWAPSIRYHDGKFYIYYGDPDFGIYQATATDPAGDWTLELVQPALGWIDPCPLWDEDGQAYLVHGYAKSRAGINSILTVRKMSADGKTISRTTGDTVNIYDVATDPNGLLQTTEGPKFYKRNGFYYVLAPYGGVAQGSQAVLRSTSPMGTYEYKAPILSQGSTDINGPHQGGYVELESGESWFIHFQELQPYGRLVHLNPMKWENDWPVMGNKGEPVRTYTKPNVGQTYPIMIPATSDYFNGDKLGLQWQWHGNWDASWNALENGKLKMFAVPKRSDYVSLWQAPNLLLQKLPSPKFSVVTKMNLNLKNTGDRAGLVSMGRAYSFFAVAKTADGYQLEQYYNTGADNGGVHRERSVEPISGSSIYLRMAINQQAKVNYSYSLDSVTFKPIGIAEGIREGVWIGSKVGVFCLSESGSAVDASSFVEFESFVFGYYFTGMLKKAELVSPPNGASIGVQTRQILKWMTDPIDGDSSFVYVAKEGATGDLTFELVNATTNSAYNLRDLEEGATYHWKILSKNDISQIESDTWRFTVADSVVSGLTNQNDLVSLFPNPANESLNLNLNIPNSGSFSVNLFAINGQLIRKLDSRQIERGILDATYSMEGIESGIYLLKIELNKRVISSSKLVIR